MTVRESVRRPARRVAGAARWALFGGTFDPPHVGHLAIAEWARVALELDHVVFMPAGRPPHKSRRAVTAAVHRLAMTRLAVRGNPAFRVSPLELRSTEPSYTVETLRRLTGARAAHVYLLLGADSLDGFRDWREPEAILAMARLAIAGRSGAGLAPASEWARRSARVAWIGNPLIGVAASELRARVRAQRSIRYLVPDAVSRYIEKHRLYRR
ncbi:MAG: nicotinate (nicotinamide) nucleotide adenylyltransferase [Candidatus Eisenbacteria bacterium]|uniref:Probable nicotinate-nucleotide adenylyltransferase n=1 Tax=Eiseniibacteriota bacterium TaxID=2212470 RepID=A0A849SSD8_UNCEI|nr:nicotinate (nicotinamide) nucleotide adenylyltransferase [Candidatus Eisenbacteria bacterium]